MQLRDDPSEQAGTIPSETGDKQAPGAHEEQKTGEPRGEQLLGRQDAAKTEAIHKGLAGSDDTQGASASEKPQNGNAHETKTQGQGTEKKMKGDDGGPAFTKREREEMEALLQQLCGHLGMSISLILSKMSLLMLVRSQWYIQLDSWRVKMWRTTFCSIRTGYFPCLFMTNFVSVRYLSLCSLAAPSHFGPSFDIVFLAADITLDVTQPSYRPTIGRSKTDTPFPQFPSYFELPYPSVAFFLHVLFLSIFLSPIVSFTQLHTMSCSRFAVSSWNGFVQ